MPKGKRGTVSVAPVGTDGLAPDVVVQHRAPAILADNLTQGCLAMYVHGDTVEGQHGLQRVHTFQLPQEQAGQQFALFGSMQLDQKLRQVDFGRVVVLVYGGKKPIPDSPDRTEHHWTVQPFLGDEKQLTQLKKTYRAGCERVALAATAAPSRAARGGSPAGIPF